MCACASVQDVLQLVINCFIQSRSSADFNEKVGALVQAPVARVTIAANS